MTNIKVSEDSRLYFVFIVIAKSETKLLQLNNELPDKRKIHDKLMNSENFRNVAFLCNLIRRLISCWQAKVALRPELLMVILIIIEVHKQRSMIR